MKVYNNSIQFKDPVCESKDHRPPSEPLPKNGVLVIRRVQRLGNYLNSSMQLERAMSPFFLLPVISLISMRIWL